MIINPSGKGLPAAIAVPGAQQFVIRPAKLLTTPTIRSSIAVALQTFPDIIGGTVSGSARYDLHPSIESHGSCIGLVWKDDEFGAFIRLTRNLVYIFGEEDACIQIQGDVYPDKMHGLVGQPITKICNHPLLDSSETITEFSTFEADDPDDAEGTGSEFRVGGKLVPMFEDIYGQPEIDHPGF